MAAMEWMSLAGSQLVVRRSRMRSWPFFLQVASELGRKADGQDEIPSPQSHARCDSTSRNSLTRISCAESLHL
eukprot:3981861-Pyramimonas_sp.AAC.1